MGLEVEIRRPSDCNQKELEQFRKLVASGGEVDPSGLEKRIARAKFLAFCYFDGQLVGTIAIKRPYRGYIEKIFTNAGFNFIDYNFDEVGWLVVDPNYRGRGIAKEMMSKIMKYCDDKSFVVIAQDNLASQMVCGRAGFEKFGMTYGNKKINLWINEKFLAKIEKTDISTCSNGGSERFSLQTNM